MNLGELRSLYRLSTMDTEKPYLVSDEEVDSFANDAVDEACRRASLIVDSSSPVAEVSLSAGDDYIELDESVIYVRRARLVSNGSTLVPRVSRTMDEMVPGWEDSIASTPLAFIPDWESGKLRLWPGSAAADTVKMTVIRTPTSQMVNDDDTPEIPARYHRALLDWMMHLGYLKRDADLFDPKKAAEHEARFTAEFGPASAAIDEHFGAEQYYDVGYR